MKKILIINPGHFGSFVDSIYHVEFLKSNFNIEYFGIKENESIDFDIKVVLLVKKSSSFKTKVYFLFKLFQYVRNNKFDILFINYFVGCSIIKFFNSSSKKVLDIRSSIISNSSVKRIFFNNLLRFESFFFSHLTVISEGVRDYLGLNSNAHILPLGGPRYNYISKDFNSFNLVYVGTFNSRNIYQTLVGFHKFYLNYRDKIRVKYRIIGTGSEYENQLLLNVISELKFDSGIVEMLGYVEHSRLSGYYEVSNIGISYIPITDYFNFQPPTKTYEYLLSGMAVIATKTYENARIIDKSNGVLCLDNSESFYNSLVDLYHRKSQFNSFAIYENAQKFSWEYIIKNNLTNYFDEL